MAELVVAVAVLKQYSEFADEELTNKISPALMLSIAYAASIGGVGTLIGTPPNGIFASQASELYGQAIGFYEWLKVGLPFVIVCVASVTFLTEITSNSACARIFIPIMAALAVGIGQHPFLLMIPTGVATSMAFMLPVATPPNAVVFGSGYISIQQMSRPGFWMNLIAIVMITIIMMTLITSILGIEMNAVPDWAMGSE